MAIHKIQTELEGPRAFTTAFSGFESPEGFCYGFGTTVGNGIQGWAPGALFIDTDAAGLQYRNTGTKTAATWTAITGQINLLDSEYVEFGTGNDVQLEWDGTTLNLAPPTGMWANCPLIHYANGMSLAYEVYDDFISTPDVTNLWTAANVGTGTTAYDPATAGGVLLLTCQATTDNACEQLTRKGAGFLLAAGKTIWYETRIKIVGDIQSEHSFGLVADGEDLTAVADVLPADGISFSTQDATLAAALTVSKGGTDTGAVSGVHTLVSGTWVTLGFLIDGITSVTPYVNGVAGTAATATIPDDEHLAPYFLVRNGDGTTQQVMHVDYVKVVQLR